MNKLLFFTLFFGLIVVSCGKESADCVAIDNADCICTMESDPVCGCDKVTYSNSCAAHCAHVDIVSEGACPE